MPRYLRTGTTLFMDTTSTSTKSSSPFQEDSAKILASDNSLVILALRESVTMLTDSMKSRSPHLVASRCLLRSLLLRLTFVSTRLEIPSDFLSEILALNRALRLNLSDSLSPFDVHHR